MSEPIVFISHNRLKQGKLDEFERVYREVVKSIEVDKPGTLVQIAYVNEERTRVTFIHLFPDAAAFDLHLQGVAERTEIADEFIESESFEVYGKPNTGVLASLRNATGPGVTLSVHPQYLGGFTRPAPG